MELLFRICLFTAGIINALPAILAFFPSKMANSYGIALPDANYELLLRHRAVLFGMVGGWMIYAAISKKGYSTALVVGLVSMLSFLVLYKLVQGPVNAELTKVAKIDVVGIVILLVGFVCYKFK